MDDKYFNLVEKIESTKNWNSFKDRGKHKYLSAFRHRLSLRDTTQDETRRHNIPLHNYAHDHNMDYVELVFENHVNQIIAKLEEDPDLLENNLESEKLRSDALRQMPQCLTIKRAIKRKLTKSVNMKPRGNPIGFLKILYYSLSIKYTKIKNLRFSLELWYSSLKTIEGHFGSAISSYFKFLRWLFLMNMVVMVVTILFIILPQITFGESVNPLYNMQTFNVWDIFTGEGSFTNTPLYYGYYTNQTKNYFGISYNMPLVYFYTMMFIYLISFLILGYSVAVSYRKSFIETEGIMKNRFMYKVFCGWDFSIATKEGANLRSNAIYNELKELLNDFYLTINETTFSKRLKAILIKMMTNMIILLVLVLSGYILWFLLVRYRNLDSGPIIIAIVANFFNVTLPMVFTKIAGYENYKNPRNAVGITLVRSYLLGVVIVGTIVAFWLMHSFTQECWETMLGQEMYRLILFDCLLSLLIHAVQIVYYRVNHHFHHKVDNSYEFDVASNSLDLIYSQSLFWVGFYFSPLLSVMVFIKIFLKWYLKMYYVLKVCKPSSKPWRASQTQTWFLSLTFLTLLGTGGLMIFILLRIPPTNCGPFQGNQYFYDVVLDEFNEDTLPPFRYVNYLTKPGVVSLIVVALMARVYYVRETVNAQRLMELNEML
ncbi:hypothetical protein HHI36_015792 [Cryptolaemus montrouzieri]|uniref:TMC domain-containing protein n=1 Tax=Cryptolaemus montrouzieri TaxID=559131 RepID=A0ABD2N7Z7_9CUCU